MAKENLREKLSKEFFNLNEQYKDSKQPEWMVRINVSKNLESVIDNSELDNNVKKEINKELEKIKDNTKQSQVTNSNDVRKIFSDGLEKIRCELSNNDLDSLDSEITKLAGEIRRPIVEKELKNTLGENWANDLLPKTKEDILKEFSEMNDLPPQKNMLLMINNKENQNQAIEITKDIQRNFSLNNNSSNSHHSPAPINPTINKGQQRSIG